MTANAYEKNDNSGVVICHICYVLHALGLIIVITSVIGMWINYFNRSIATPECLSHHNWMIKTFWIRTIVLLVTIIPFANIAQTSFIGQIVVWTVYILLHVWYIYRIVKGWRRLCQRKSIG